MLSAMKNIKYVNGILSDGESYCGSDGLGRPLERWHFSQDLGDGRSQRCKDLGGGGGEQVPGESSDHTP